jgi:ATP-dependent Clp protease ATP-binding subunit ClpA
MLRQKIEEGCREFAAQKGNSNRTSPVALDHLLSRATTEARNLHHKHAGTGHLLLAMLREANSLTGIALRNLGLSVPDVTKAVLKELDPNQSN